jgi:hypothetical protein
LSIIHPLPRGAGGSRTNGGEPDVLWALIASNLVALAGLLYAVYKVARYRELKKMRGVFGPWPVRQIGPGEFDPGLASGAMGPKRDSAIRFVADLGLGGSTSALEAWIICNLAKRAKRVFEFGTATGRTTYLIAANAPETEVVTITLPPAQLGDYRAAAGDDPAERKSIVSHSQYDTTFYYSGTPEAARITQLLGDSKAFDDGPYAGSCDLVFIDGSHAYSYVESDTQKALRMVRPGGVVLWHDYRGPRAPIDVFRYLNRLAGEMPLVHFRGTALVAWRRPAA